ncbi:MAG: hypothetical protein RMI94_15510 [Bryobacterales bacterium]|nr:hypothetical protein [Bryobacteraceae bacterium]MDW8131955.1 hypothetical protein [Bryobacterales bacterium]
MCCGRPNRREFLLAGCAAALPATPAAAWPDDLWDPERPYRPGGKPLRVEPVLMYRVPQRREAASWKSWGGVQSDESAAAEAARIERELKALAERAPFPLEIAPVARVSTTDAAAALRQAPDAVRLIYAATGSGEMLRALMTGEGEAIVFVRRRSGPVYYWYEALSTRYLRKRGEPRGAGSPPLSVEDVVVDELGELEWRLRALFAVKNFLAARVVALGGARGKYAPEAPQVARERFRLDIVEVGYREFAPRVRAALADSRKLAQAVRWTERYLRLPGTKLETERRFVIHAFLLYGLLRELLREHEASILTIAGCMGTILPIAQTTACLALSLLNDEGFLALCESDFVIIPACILLWRIARAPVFLHNSTFPHGGLVTCAHCTAPRRMNGLRYEPARILTHYESEYGAAPKVEMPVGQRVTFLNPEYATCRWIGMRGLVEGNPFYEICRSQQDVRIEGDWRRLLDEVRDSHWAMAYGDWLREAGYAAPRIGVRWEAISAC